MQRLCLLASLVVTLFGHAPASAAEVDLYGLVKDAGQGEAIPGAKVTVFRQSTDRTWQELVSTRTSTKGTYELTKVPVGKTRLLFEGPIQSVPYKKEEVIVTLQTPPLRREIPIALMLLTASASYFQRVGETKAARLNDYATSVGIEQAAALYRWEWYTCIIGLSAYQTKLCADGLYNNVSTKIPMPAGVKPFAKVDSNALGAIVRKLGEGSTPTLLDLQQNGVPAEVAWFTQWQRLEKSGATTQEIERNRKVLFEYWKLPSDSALFVHNEKPYYPVSAPQGG